MPARPALPQRTRPSPPAAPGEDRGQGARWHGVLRRWRATPAVLVVVGAVAFAARLHAMVAGGGLGGITNYDDGVYFAGAQALVSGRLPYRDYVLLHPPGIVLVLTPFAALARVLSDPRAFELARLAFMVLGAANAVLVAAVARRSSLTAAAVAGLLYALWPPAVYAEVTTLLTPWSTLGMLVALALLHRRAPGPRGELLAGVALGLAAGVKIWGVVPLAVVAVRQGAVAGWRSAARLLLGATLALGAVCLPFFVAAPGPMFRMVVTDQLGRGRTDRSVLSRVSGMLGLAHFGGGLRPAGGLLVVAAVLLVALAVLGAAAERAWLVVALLGAVVTVLLTAPSYFAHYGAFAAGPLLVLAGTGAAALARLAAGRGRRPAPSPLPARAPVRPGRVAAALAATALLGPAVLAATGAGLRVGSPFPGRALGAAAAASRCVTSDSPVALIEMNVQGRDLARGCPVRVDVSGITYDTARVRGPAGVDLPRRLNPVWQAALIGYLTSGDATILVRRRDDGLTPGSARLVRALPVLARVRGFTLHAVPRPHP